MADYIGSTTGILKYATHSPDKEFIVATEVGIMHQMQKDNPIRYLSRHRQIITVPVMIART
jgi:quinolinate synthase